MMVSNQKAQEVYRNARNALNNIARSRRATPVQRQKARDAMTELTVSYVDKLIEKVEERTIQFQDFITSMETVIESIGSDSPIRALGTLQDIVAESKQIVDAVYTTRPASIN